MIISPTARLSVVSAAILTFLALQLPAQTDMSFVGVGYKGGRPHPDDRYGSLISYTNSLEVAWKKEHLGDQSWEKLLRGPQTTWGMKYTDFGNPNIGKSVATFYTLGIPILKFERISLVGIMGGGLAYFSNKFDPETNPENVAISSDFTFLTRFGAALQFSARRWRYEVRWDFDHYSTAAMSQPNIGINKNTFGLMIYRGWEVSEGKRGGAPFDLASRLNIVIGTGFREVQDEAFQHWNIYGIYNFRINDFIGIGAGSGIFVNGSVRREQELAGRTDPAMVRWGLSLGPQLTLDRVLVNLNFGAYLIDPFNDDGWPYQHMMARYFLTKNLSMAISLVTHSFSESYSFDAGIGISL